MGCICLSHTTLGRWDQTARADFCKLIYFILVPQLLRTSTRLNRLAAGSGSWNFCVHPGSTLKKFPNMNKSVHKKPWCKVLGWVDTAKYILRHVFIQKGPQDGWLQRTRKGIEIQIKCPKQEQMHFSLSSPPENTGRGQMKDKLFETRQNEQVNERKGRKEHFHWLLWCRIQLHRPFEQHDFTSHCRHKKEFQGRGKEKKKKKQKAALILLPLNK